MLKKLFGIVLVTSAFIILCALGHWQIERAAWKEEIIAQLETEYAKDPLQHRLTFSDLKNTNIQHGHIRGKFDYTKQILVGPKTHNSNIGYDAIIPMALTKGGNVLVNIGWVKGEKREEIKTPSPHGYITLTGISRAPDWNKFTPNNSPENNSWTKLDIQQIAKAKNITLIAPTIFYAKSASLTLKEFHMLEENWMPRNKHMQYTIFWFSMAGILLIITSLVIIKRRKTKV